MFIQSIALFAKIYLPIPLSKDRHQILFSLDETHLVVVRGLTNQPLPKYVNEESSTGWRSYNRQVNRSSQLYCQDLSQYY